MMQGIRTCFMVSEVQAAEGELFTQLPPLA